MTVTRRSTTLLLAVATGAFLMLGGVALAGDYHQGASLHCSDCHIMHASKDGTIYGGGTQTNPTGNDNLLKGSATSLCMACHDGTDTTAPDIVATGTAGAPNDTLGISYTSKYKNSAGYFQSDYGTVANGAAHDLYAASALTAVQGTWTSAATGMNCADCHDPHGTSNYRNLLLDPATTGTDVTIASGTSGTQDVYLEQAITVPATATATATHYDTGAVGFNDTGKITDWCINCHTNIASDTASPWTKHPQDVAVSTLDDTGTHWTTGTGSGFGTDVGDGTSGIPRVRFAQNGTTFTAVTTVADTNQIFCLTCHKGHGSKYDSSTVWPHYVTDDADQTSACDQCHNKGA